MAETIRIGDISISMVRKAIKHVHLSVHPPLGRVSMAAPIGTRVEVARAYAISRLGWIREQRTKLASQEREPGRRYVERESQYLWGRRYLLSISEVDAKPEVRLGHRTITLCVRPGSSADKRAEVMHEWHKAQLHDAVRDMVKRWEGRLGVKVARWHLQRMKTRWGSCNPQAKHIRLNTELVKKPKDLVEYVVAHEMCHLVEPTHRPRFIELLTQHYPSWKDARAELNALPLGAAEWRE